MEFLRASLLIVFYAAFAAVTPKAADTNMFEETIPPGENYSKADFRLWIPEKAESLQGAVVLVPGSNADGRSMAGDPIWQEFAMRHKLALVGCRFTDKPNDQPFIEQYANAARGSGQALLDALAALANRSNHPELAGAPLLLWGMSAGGEFNYEFVAWKPERVISFVVNKGGIYYSALVQRAARKVPGIFFIGGKDIEFRNNTVVGLFTVNRRAGALWALAEEPGVSHDIGRSRDMSIIYFEDVLRLRMASDVNSAAQTGLRSLDEKSGFLGDIKTKSFRAAADAGVPDYPTAWLPTLRVAHAWQALVNDQPFAR